MHLILHHKGVYDILFSTEALYISGHTNSNFVDYLGWIVCKWHKAVNRRLLWKTLA